MGYCENSREVNLYGLAAEEHQPKAFLTDRRFPAASEGGLMSKKLKPTFTNFD